jgi:hypothetical protein
MYAISGRATRSGRVKTIIKPNMSSEAKVIYNKENTNGVKSNRIKDRTAH